MGKIIDRTNVRYGKLTARYIHHFDTRNTAYWYCDCECGGSTIVRGGLLTKNRVKSCGCAMRGINTKHGDSHTRLNWVWQAMKQRCLNPNNKEYKNYSSRGIRVCGEWAKAYTDFKEWAQRNGYREGLTIDRINNDGDYCPENCRWVNRKVQCRNKSDNRLLEYNGKTQPIASWADETGIDERTIWKRLYRGWTVERTLTIPKKA